LVRARNMPATVSVDGIQPSSAPWCSSSVTMAKPFLSMYSTMSSDALYISECVFGSRPGRQRLKREMDMTMRHILHLMAPAQKASLGGDDAGARDDAADVVRVHELLDSNRAGDEAEEP